MSAAPTFVDGAGGVPIAVWDLGGDGPPLLLAHATGFHGLMYAPMAAALTGAFHVHAFDARGHGRSGTPSLEADADGRVPAMSWDLFGADALAVVDAFGFERPVAFGHSCGGALLLLAEQARPGTFAAMATYEPVVFPTGALPPGERPPLAEGARRRRPVFASFQAALDNFASKPPMAAFRPDVLEAYVAGGFAPEPDGTVRLRCSPDAEAATYAMAPEHRAFDRMAEVACPLLVACGGERPDFGIDIARLVAGGAPRGTAVEVAGSGHFGPFTDPGGVGRLIAAALTDGSS